MSSAFVGRRPWATVVVSFIFGPAIGMFYLGKGRNGLVYLLFTISVLVLVAATIHLEILDLDFEASLNLSSWLVYVVGVPHCYFVSKRLQGHRPTAWFARWYNLLGVFFLAPVFVAIALRSLYMEPFSIPSGAMIPTLKIGDHLFVSKYAYGYTRYSFPFSPPLFEGRFFDSLPERGDVAVFRKPGQEDTDYIMRIVGLPGDRIQMIRGVLHINGEPVKRERLSGQEGTGPYTQYIETLPNGRQHLIQERSDREVTDNTSEYLVPEGHFFMMGDNRDNSQDSRALYDVGYVPFENLIGRLEFIFWNSLEGRVTFEKRD